MLPSWVRSWCYQRMLDLTGKWLPGKNTLAYFDLVIRNKGKKFYNTLTPGRSCCPSKAPVLEERPAESQWPLSCWRPWWWRCRIPDFPMFFRFPAWSNVVAGEWSHRRAPSLRPRRQKRGKSESNPGSWWWSLQLNLQVRGLLKGWFKVALKSRKRQRQ